MKKTLSLALTVVSTLVPMSALAQTPPAPTSPAPSARTPVAPAHAAPDKTPIYDEKADAKEQIAAALAKAKKENTRVLVVWGFNRCPWCHLLHKTFAADPSIRKELLNEYQVVMVDTGPAGKNVELLASYGADKSKLAFPHLTILDASGKTLVNQETGSLELKGPDGNSIEGDKAGHDPEKILALLKKYETTPQSAETVLNAAIAEAKQSNRKVFLHFGAPWCGWCHRLEDWLAKPTVSAAVAKGFVEVKIDQDRMPGAKEIEERFKMPKDSGIPWFLVLDPVSGKTLSNSTGPKGNIGYPGSDEEISYFLEMLASAKTALSEADLAALKQSLVENRPPPPPSRTPAPPAAAPPRAAPPAAAPPAAPTGGH